MKRLSLLGILLPMSFSLGAVGAEIISIDYTAHLNPYLHSKTGVAAVGNSTNDVWNVYSRDVSSDFDWRSSGTIEHLKWTDGTSTDADLDVSNAGGAWYTFSADAMMES